MQPDLATERADLASRARAVLTLLPEKLGSSAESECDGQFRLNWDFDQKWGNKKRSDRRLPQAQVAATEQ